MFVPAPIPQDKLARDQYANTLTLNKMVLSTIDALVPITQAIVVRDSTSEPSLPVTIGSILGGIAFLLLLAALAYFLWRVRQGRVHVDRIGLAHIVPRQRFDRHPSHSSSFSVTKTRMQRRVSTEAYNPQAALPWSLLRNYRPTPAPTAPAPVTLPLPRINRSGPETPTMPEIAHVIDSHPQEPHRLLAPSFNHTSRSNNNTPIPHTPPPAWRSLSPRPPTYDSDDGPSSSGH